MRGHVTKRGKNSWSIVFDAGTDPLTGKRRQQWISVRGSKKDAEKKLAEVLTQLQTGGFVRPARETVGAFLQRWLRDYVATNCRPRTYEGYEQIIRCHLLEAFGNVPLSQLQASHLQAYYSKALKEGRKDGTKGGLSPRTVLHHHRVMNEALVHAVKWGLVARNIALVVDPPRPHKVEPKIMDVNGVHKLLAEAKDTMYYPIIHLAVFTGLRRSEILGLRWMDLDLDMCTLSVSQVLIHLRSGASIFQEPKTDKSKRQVALSPAVVLALKAYKEHREAAYATFGMSINPEHLVFGQLDGSPLLPDTITHAFAKIVKRIGLEGVRLHDTRHTHATLMLRAGVHPKIVQERLGHATIATTLDIYSHVTPGLQEAAALKFDQALGEISIPSEAIPATPR